MTAGDGDVTPARECSSAEAEALGAQVMAAAGDVARQEAVFLGLVGEFDAAGAVGHWTGLRSTAHWLAWACSIAPGTAREHVRVARALRQMPATQAAFEAGELTFSKVRELTRLTGRLPAPTGDADSAEKEEGRLVGFARCCTASQLARTVAGYRAAEGTARLRCSRQRVSWLAQDDGCIHLTAVLPAEDGAAVVAAIQAATEANQIPDPEPGDIRPDDRQPGESSDETQQQARERTKIEALCEVANHYLASRPEDRSGEDRTLVVMEVDAAALTEAPADDAPATTQPATLESATAAKATADAQPQLGDVPAGAPPAKCRVRGGAAIDRSTARRALCDTSVLGIIRNGRGEPLAVGREHRLVTRAQRRALMSRDGCCQYPACAQTRRLKAHHRTSWLDGGATDLDNLILLCQWHHSRVHEDRIAISACPKPDCTVHWRFTRPDGTSITPTVVGLNAPSPWRPLISCDHRPLTGPAREMARRRNDERVAAFHAEQARLRDQAAALRAGYDHVHDSSDPEARRVFPVGAGEGFHLANCVDVLFDLTESRMTQAA